MAASIIDGKAIAQKRRDVVAQRVAELRKRGVTPGLAVVIIGSDPASEVYVRMKHKACDEAGIRSFKHELAADVSQADLLALVEKLNEDPEVHGILVQLPLPTTSTKTL